MTKVDITVRMIGPPQDVKVSKGDLGPVPNLLRLTSGETMMPSKEVPLSGISLGGPISQGKGFPVFCILWISRVTITKL